MFLTMSGVLVFRSSQLFEADQIAAALDENGIPFFRREDAGGVERAMPFAPSQFPGVFWAIYVPAEVEAQARSLIAAAPFDPQRDAKWEPSASDHRRWIYFLTAVFVGMVLIIYSKCSAV